MQSTKLKSPMTFIFLIGMTLCTIFISRKFPFAQSSQTPSKSLLIINPLGTLHMNEMLIKVRKSDRAGFIRTKVVHPKKRLMSNFSQHQSMEMWRPQADTHIIKVIPSNSADNINMITCKQHQSCLLLFLSLSL